MQGNQLFCNCGAPILSNQTRCQVCGNKTSVLSRDVESSLDAWQRYNDATAKKETAESESNSEFPSGNQAATKTGVVSDKVLRRKTIGSIWAITYTLASGLALIGMLIYAYIQAHSEFESNLPTSPIQTQPNSVNKLSVGDQWDIYIAYYVDCAISQREAEPEHLGCSWNGYNIDTIDNVNLEKYIVPTWVENETTREIVCINPYKVGFKFDNSLDVPAVDKYLELQIDQSNGLLVTAGLVSPPILEETTISRVIDLNNTSSLFGSEYSGVPTERESETYAGGFCIAHFRVNEMPAFSSALRIYFTNGDFEWTLNPDELQSHNFLILTRDSDNYILDLWNSNNFSSLVESFNH